MAEPPEGGEADPSRGRFLEKQGTFHHIQMHSPMRDIMFEKSRSKCERINLGGQLSVQEMGSAQESLFEPENEGPLMPPPELVIQQVEKKKEEMSQHSKGNHIS